MDYIKDSFLPHLLSTAQIISLLNNTKLSAKRYHRFFPSQFQ